MSKLPMKRVPHAGAGTATSATGDSATAAVTSGVTSVLSTVSPMTPVTSATVPARGMTRRELVRAAATLAMGAAATATFAGWSRGLAVASEDVQDALDTPDAADSASADGESRPRMAVACFSATGHTMEIARSIADHYGIELVQIVPEVPYTEEDLDYNDSSSRTSIEVNDPAARPGIASGLVDCSELDVLFLGYAMWWGAAAVPMRTYVESVDFAGTVVVPFCTSASSPFGSSAKDLEALALLAAANRAGEPDQAATADEQATAEEPADAGDPAAADDPADASDSAEASASDGTPDGACGVWLEGRRFAIGTPAEEVAAWVDGIDLAGAIAQVKGEGENVGAGLRAKVSIAGEELGVTLEDCEASRALLDLMPLDLAMTELNGNEKYCYLEESLPTQPFVPDTIEAGDLMLYGDSCLVIFYETFPTSYSYTRLGRVDDPARLAELVGAGDVQVTFTAGE